MISKIEIKGKIELVTGLHIGGGESFSAIGDVDSTIIKDKLTQLPIIPGSSFKGKLRALLAKHYRQKNPTENPNDDNEILLDIFGCSDDKNKNKRRKSRVIFSDMIMSNWETLKNNYGLENQTEVKFENSIKRITCEATPRQIERAIRGSEFDLSIIYEVEDEEILKHDMKILSTGLKLMTYDYLGGNGTRGYGKIKFNNLKTELLIGKVSKDTLSRCDELLKDVN